MKKIHLNKLQKMDRALVTFNVYNVLNKISYYYLFVSDRPHCTCITFAEAVTNVGISLSCLVAGSLLGISCFVLVKRLRTTKRK